MKILHVTQGTIGGTLEYFKMLLPRLESLGFEVEVACPSYGPMAEDLRCLGITVHNLEMKREISLLHDLMMSYQLFGIIKSNRYDLVHLHSSKAGAVGRMANLLVRLPCVYTPHGWSFTMRTTKAKKRMYVWIEKFLALFADRIVAISQSEKEIAEREKVVSGDRIQLIVNGIDVSRFSARDTKEAINKRKKELGIPPGHRIIGMTGRLAESKDPLTFVHMARLILAKDKNYTFLMVGDGELRHQVEAEIKRLGIEEHFRLTGWVQDVKPYVHIMDVGVVPSKWEGFGLVIAEFMASGIPVVASKIDGIDNVIVDGQSGLLVEQGNSGAFAESVMRVATDLKLRNEIIRGGLERVRTEFDITRVVQEHVELYSKIICLKQPAPLFNNS